MKASELIEHLKFYIDITGGDCEMLVFDKAKGCSYDITHWEGLPFDKSLFNLDDYIGIPIGNLTSQLFASFLLNGFDHWIIEKLGFKYYGRYVDDFYIIDNDKEKLANAIPLIKEYLRTTVSVTLHPNKVYIQHYTKGVKFIGSVIKPNRIYVGNRLKGNAWNVFKEISEDIKKGYTSKADILHYRCRLNSYLGFMRHRSSYNIRKKLFSNEYHKSIEKLSNTLRLLFNGSHKKRLILSFNVLS